MKLFIQIFIFLFTIGQAVAQEKEVYTIVENPAVFPGGMSEMMNFISTNLKYPEKARESAIGGKMFIKFIVNETGLISDVEILKSTGSKELDNEAIRVVNSMPKWKPANMAGKDVKCYFNLPMKFALDSPYFIFNVWNKNEKYLLAKDAIEANDLDKALDLYQQDVGDVEALYNTAVIYFLRNYKSKSKKCFENVKSSVTDTNNQYYRLSDKFLMQNF